MHDTSHILYEVLCSQNAAAEGLTQTALYRTTSVTVEFQQTFMGAGLKQSISSQMTLLFTKTTQLQIYIYSLCISVAKSSLGLTSFYKYRAKCSFNVHMGL